MSYKTMQQLSPVEQNMPLAKYFYDYPMKDLPEEVKSVIFGHPMDPKDAIPAEKFIDWMLPCGKYLKNENGIACLRMDRDTSPHT